MNTKDVVRGVLGLAIRTSSLQSGKMENLDHSAVGIVKMHVNKV